MVQVKVSKIEHFKDKTSVFLFQNSHHFRQAKNKLQCFEQNMSPCLFLVGILCFILVWSGFLLGIPGFPFQDSTR